jgi:ABC-type Mn2+/Zn2+ transport system ATPase subunit
MGSSVHAGLASTAGKSTTIRILMGLVPPDSGAVRVFGKFVASIYPRWDAAYATTLLDRFNLEPTQPAFAVCGKPELLFLDEPTAGLDVQSRRAMWATIQDLLVNGCSIVLTTHYLEEAEARRSRGRAHEEPRHCQWQRRRDARAGFTPTDQLRKSCPRGRNSKLARCH